jgi:ATP-binding cassette, subfamily B, bacterial MsbA
MALVNQRKHAKNRGVAFDAHSRSLLSRFLNDWVRPRWRELLVALALTTGLAAATGAYPMVIKFSFDNLLKGDVT